MAARPPKGALTQVDPMKNELLRRLGRPVRAFLLLASCVVFAQASYGASVLKNAYSRAENRAICVDDRVGNSRSIENGRLASKSDRGVITTYNYEGSHRTSATRSTGETLQYFYDSRGHISHIQSNRGHTVTWTWSENGKKLLAIESTTGTKLTIERNGPRIRSVTLRKRNGTSIDLSYPFVGKSKIAKNDPGDEEYPWDDNEFFWDDMFDGADMLDEEEWEYWDEDEFEECTVAPSGPFEGPKRKLSVPKSSRAKALSCPATAEACIQMICEPAYDADSQACSEMNASDYEKMICYQQAIGRFAQCGVNCRAAFR
jgi:YD repeat-containing protein